MWLALLDLLLYDACLVGADADHEVLLVRKVIDRSDNLGGTAAQLGELRVVVKELQDAFFAAIAFLSCR
jgi:hypothetical protein